jgi:hypothetical protein
MLVAEDTLLQVVVSLPFEALPFRVPPLSVVVFLESLDALPFLPVALRRRHAELFVTPRLDPAETTRVFPHLQQGAQIAKLLIDPLSADLQPEWVAHHRIPCCPIDLLGGVVRYEAMKQIVPHVLPSKLVLLVA